MKKTTLFLSFFLLPTLAFAATTNIDTVLQNLLGYITSGPAHIIALLAIVGCGFATFRYGKLSKEKFIAVVIAIGIIFGASDILSMLNGS